MSGHTELELRLMRELREGLGLEKFTSSMEGYAEAGHEDGLRLAITSGALANDVNLALAAAPIVGALADRQAGMDLYRAWVDGCGYGTPQGIAFLLAHANDPQRVEALMAMGPDLDASFPDTDGHTRSALGLALWKRNGDAVIAMLEYSLRNGFAPLVGSVETGGEWKEGTFVDHLFSDAGRSSSFFLSEIFATLDQDLVRSTLGAEIAAHLRQDADAGVDLCECHGRGMALWLCSLAEFGGVEEMRKSMVCTLPEGGTDVAWLIGTDNVDDIQETFPATQDVLERLLSCGMGPDDVRTDCFPSGLIDLIKERHPDRAIDVEEVNHVFGEQAALCTMAHVAALSNNVETLGRLLDAGADPSAKVMRPGGERGEAMDVDVRGIARMFGAKGSLQAIDAWMARQAVSTVRRKGAGAVLPAGRGA